MATYDASTTVSMSGVEVSAKDAHDFLVASNALRACEACGAESWDISISPGQGKIPMIPTTGGLSRDDVQIATVFFSTCGNCGLIRLHGMGTLYQWKLLGLRRTDYE